MWELESQVGQYKLVRPLYVTFAEVLKAALSRATKDLGIEAIVQTRAKGIPNFAEKALRKRGEYPDAVNQFNDLCGARIITNTIDEIAPVCDFIRKHFIVDQASSEDVSQRLGAGEFGYRSIHFTVSLPKGEFQKIIKELAQLKEMHEESGAEAFMASLGKLYECRSIEECRDTRFSPGPKYRVEIQVRSLLQHAWATFVHDRFYKSDFDVPLRLQRNSNRVAAMLEEADATFTRTRRGLAEYKTYFGAYMTPDERYAEIERLRAVLSFDAQNRRLAHRIARLAISLEKWTQAEVVLQSFIQDWESPGDSCARSAREILEEAWNAIESSTEKVGKQAAKSRQALKPVERQEALEKAERQLERLRDSEMARIVSDFGISIYNQPKRSSASERRKSRRYLELAIALDRRNVDHYVALAATFEDSDKTRSQALEWYERAFNVDPTEPRALNGFLRYKILVEKDLRFLTIVRPSLEAAIARCRERARTGVYLPHAHYDIGLFALVLGRPYESLAAFARAMDLSDSETVLGRYFHRMDQIRRAAGRNLPASDWVCRFLAAAKVARAWQGARAATTRLETVHAEHAKTKTKLEGLLELPATRQDKASIADARKSVRLAGRALREASADVRKTRRGIDRATDEAGTAMEGAAVGGAKRPYPVFAKRDRVLIVAGGCDESVQHTMVGYSALLDLAFTGYKGVVISGGTTAGISGLIGDLPSPRKGGMRKIGYLPDSCPVSTSRHPGYKNNVYHTPGTGFSALEPIQSWIDMLASKAIDPADVKLLGINGGKIAALEFRMALAFGARVGVLRDSGRAVNDILEDEDWRDHPSLIVLPNDPQTVRIFVQG
ncbi:MAG: hypothetical protein KAY24_00435, partial [Candidatus Eisenbacteria sp.]|nr:hypothetical protein [Candidatus Eisenbacteria bacterium]